MHGNCINRPPPKNIYIYIYNGSLGRCIVQGVPFQVASREPKGKPLNLGGHHLLTYAHLSGTRKPLTSGSTKILEVHLGFAKVLYQGSKQQDLLNWPGVEPALGALGKKNN